MRRIGGVVVATVGLTAGALSAAAAADVRHDVSLYGNSRTIGHSAGHSAGHSMLDHANEQQSSRGELVDTGGESRTMLYAGLAFSLCVLGVLAVAAARSRRTLRP
ncbi:hypothetical protein ACFQ7F_13240 [Streptomyces sp. NPDC056486]|uniref:hypothetical protein n=1 Tax=Streptomyces sp. NPDC056486 TaxID=3345835 RepID=UPI00369E96AC